MTVTRAQIVAEALSWEGTPFMDQRAMKHVGCDCLGLIRGIAHNLRLDIGREADLAPLLGYGRNPDPEQLRAGLAKFLTPIGVAAAKPGDVLLIDSAHGFPRHVAVLLPDDRIIHAMNSPVPQSPRGRVVRHRIDASWRRKLIGAYAAPGVID